MFVSCCLTMNKSAVLFLLFLIAFTNYCACKKRAYQPTYYDVQTELGSYRGESTYSHGEVFYYKFRGIRYALPPSDYKRFDDAPAYDKTWHQPIDTLEYKPNCLAFDNLHYTQNTSTGEREYEVTGSEDCLYLNVHTAAFFTTKKPVIFFIHGGGFGFGGPDQFSSDYIMNREVVYVNIAYRLGPLGFLSTGDHVVPGNMGLKDQLLALQWVNKNIELFGGDKSRITITGMSAGGVSVHYMYLSPLTDGLFHRGFTHSGTALCPWALWHDIPEKTRKLAKHVDCPATNTERMIDCLRQTDARKIVGAMAHFKVFLFNPFTIFGPVVDSYSPRPYLPISPLEALQNKKFKDLPFITGVTAEDGLYSAAEYIVNTKQMKRLIDNWRKYLPHILFYDAECDNTFTRVALFVQKIILERRADEKISFASSLLQMISNRLYMSSALLSSSLMARNNTSPVRVYYFRYRGTYSTSDILINEAAGDDVQGLVGHADDCAYIYKLPGMDMRNLVNDRSMSNEMINLLVTFAEKGDVPQSFNMWQPLDGDLEFFNYLDINGPKWRYFLNQKSLYINDYDPVLQDCEN